MSRPRQWLIPPSLAERVWCRHVTVFAGQVLKLVTDFLPAWYTDSEVERVDWLNKTLAKVSFLLFGTSMALLFVVVPFCFLSWVSCCDHGLFF